LLHKIPFTELKIDQQFVHNACEDESAKAILKFCSSLGKNLDLLIVAEGVENDNDWDSATQAGCDEIQGYLIAKPMPFENLIEWQKKYSDQISS
jgi:EAL domain-containing protein (putative c-di-GMP-specific phosphodiesterase class I)